jgi:hypothetical protein
MRTTRNEGSLDPGSSLGERGRATPALAAAVPLELKLHRMLRRG